MALTTNELAIHLGIIEANETLDPTMTTRLSLVLSAAGAEVREYIGTAAIAQALLDVAVIRLSAYLWDENPARRNKNLNPLRASGAMALLVRHREYKASEAVLLTNQELLDAGFTESEIARLKQLAQGDFLRLE